VGTIIPVAHRVLPHTADTGVEAVADSLAALICELATAMFGLVAETLCESVEKWIEVRVESPTVEDLVVDALSALLSQSEVEDVFLCAFEVTMAPDAFALTIRAEGVPTSRVEAIGPPIKAVTYHNLVVEETAHGWYARVYFDV
jgi:SHS2 domain-containing protein